MFDNLKLFQENYEDVRFGSIDIYQNLSSDELIMIKKLTLSSDELYEHY